MMLHDETPSTSYPFYRVDGMEVYELASGNSLATQIEVD
jgi:hypothetical protein